MIKEFTAWCRKKPLRYAWIWISPRSDDGKEEDDDAARSIWIHILFFFMVCPYVIISSRNVATVEDVLVEVGRDAEVGRDGYKFVSIFTLWYAPSVINPVGKCGNTFEVKVENDGDALFLRGYGVQS